VPKSAVSLLFSEVWYPTWLLGSSNRPHLTGKTRPARLAGEIPAKCGYSQRVVLCYTTPPQAFEPSSGRRVRQSGVPPTSAPARTTPMTPMTPATSTNQTSHLSTPTVLFQNRTNWHIFPHIPVLIPSMLTNRPSPHLITHHPVPLSPCHPLPTHHSSLTTPRPLIKNATFCHIKRSMLVAGAPASLPAGSHQMICASGPLINLVNRPRITYN
jgi:hypothetical protein